MGQKQNPPASSGPEVIAVFAALACGIGAFPIPWGTRVMLLPLQIFMLVRPLPAILAAPGSAPLRRTMHMVLTEAPKMNDGNDRQDMMQLKFFFM